jgi:hypothetical protein
VDRDSNASGFISFSYCIPYILADNASFMRSLYIRSDHCWWMVHGYHFWINIGSCGSIVLYGGILPDQSFIWISLITADLNGLQPSRVLRPQYWTHRGCLKDLSLLHSSGLDNMLDQNHHGSTTLLHGCSIALAISWVHAGIRIFHL